MNKSNIARIAGLALAAGITAGLTVTPATAQSGSSQTTCARASPPASSVDPSSNATRAVVEPAP